MSQLSFIQHPVDTGNFGAIGRLIRQICLLREQADPEGAARLQENELSAAVRELRAARGAEILPESELQAMFVTEERRVADAVTLSEILIPQLVGRLPVAWQPVSSATRSAPATAVQPPARPAGPPAIPDLLDAMLAAERTSPRTRR